MFLLLYNSGPFSNHYPDSLPGRLPARDGCPVCVPKDKRLSRIELPEGDHHFQGVLQDKHRQGLFREADQAQKHRCARQGRDLQAAEQVHADVSDTVVTSVEVLYLLELEYVIKNIWNNHHSTV